ncbi:MAG: DUF1640 domain-containing protein [Magnetococcales bacterium]|nr:DUF1640 domain-containing protein [Magnetococcales bacterium]
MTTAITFDTLKFTRTLRDSGMPESQAEAVAKAFREAQGEAELATKADISRLEAKMESMELRLTIRLGGMIAAAVVITGAFVKLL